MTAEFDGMSIDYFEANYIFDRLISTTPTSTQHDYYAYHGLGNKEDIQIVLGIHLFSNSNLNSDIKFQIGEVNSPNSIYTILEHIVEVSDKRLDGTNDFDFIGTFSFTAENINTKNIVRCTNGVFKIYKDEKRNLQPLNLEN